MKLKLLALASTALLLQMKGWAQTDHDAIMMNKNQWCNGVSYEHMQWKDYWEGTLKRDNANIGTFTSQMAMFMSNYGITNNLNVMAGVPYVWNHVSGGTLHKIDGLQDGSLAVKWRPFSTKWGNSKLSFYGIGSVSTPLSNYDVDFMPLAIGFHSTNFTGRAMADYQKGKFFATASAAYTIRSNTKIDQNAYYTDHMIYSDEVNLPNMNNVMLSAGLRSRYLIAEAMISATTTLGGTDIRRNDMPHPWNRMNMANIGAHVKYTLPFYTHVEITADASHTIDGGGILKARNVGQATNFGFGVYYLFNFKTKSAQPATHS